MMIRSSLDAGVWFGFQFVAPVQTLSVAPVQVRVAALTVLSEAIARSAVVVNFMVLEFCLGLVRYLQRLGLDSLPRVT